MRDGRGARRVDPIAFTEESEQFGVNITDEEFEGLETDEADPETIEDNQESGA